MERLDPPIAGNVPTGAGFAGHPAEGRSRGQGTDRGKGRGAACRAIRPATTCRQRAISVPPEPGGLAGSRPDRQHENRRSVFPVGNLGLLHGIEDRIAWAIGNQAPSFEHQQPVHQFQHALAVGRHENGLTWQN